MFEFNFPTGFNNRAQGCGTPLPWVGNPPQFPFTPTGLRHIGANAVWENRRNSVGVAKTEGKTSFTQGSGVPQPWAMLWHPFGILKTYIGISLPYPEGKGAGNDKSATWERDQMVFFSSLRSSATLCVSALSFGFPFTLHPLSFILHPSFSVCSVHSVVK